VIKQSAQVGWLAGGEYFVCDAGCLELCWEQGGVVAQLVGRRTCVIRRSRVRLPVCARLRNDHGQVVHTLVSLPVTKRYILVPVKLQ